MENWTEREREMRERESERKNQESGKSQGVGIKWFQLQTTLTCIFDGISRLDHIPETKRRERKN